MIGQKPEFIFISQWWISANEMNYDQDAASIDELLPWRLKLADSDAVWRPRLCKCGESI